MWQQMQSYYKERDRQNANKYRNLQIEQTMEGCPTEETHFSSFSGSAYG